MVALVTCLDGSCALSQAFTLGLGMAELGRRLGFSVVFVPRVLSDGRVVLSFTSTWLSQCLDKDLPAPMGRLN